MAYQGPLKGMDCSMYQGPHMGISRMPASEMIEPRPAFDSKFGTQPITMKSTAELSIAKPLSESGTEPFATPREVEKAPVAQMVKIYSRATNLSVPVPLYSFGTLERMSRQGLMQVASALRDVLAPMHATNVAPVNLHAQQSVLIEWVLRAQVAIAKSVGVEASLNGFGWIECDGHITSEPDGFSAKATGHLEWSKHAR